MKKLYEKEIGKVFGKILTKKGFVEQLEDEKQYTKQMNDFMSRLDAYENRFLDSIAKFISKNIYEDERDELMREMLYLDMKHNVLESYIQVMDKIQNFSSKTFNDRIKIYYSVVYNSRGGVSSDITKEMIKRILYFCNEYFKMCKEDEV